jgi:hypothetical protein
MSDHTLTQTKTAAPTFAPVNSGVLQRKCACGNHTVAGGECAECGKTKNTLQRQASHQSAAGASFSLPGIPVMQRKLTVGASSDPLEQEADRIAGQVLAAPSRPGISGAPPRIQRYSGPSNGQMDAVPASVDRVLVNPGVPMEPALQQDMGQRFGYDFSRVRVHSSGDAEQSALEVNANAYTVGHNIVFSAGRYSPGTHEGRQLIAHELTHVVQQSQNPTTSKAPIASPSHPSEIEATQAASAALSSTKNTLLPRVTMPRQLSREPKVTIDAI